MFPAACRQCGALATRRHPFTYIAIQVEHPGNSRETASGCRGCKSVVAVCSVLGFENPVVGRICQIRRSTTGNRGIARCLLPFRRSRQTIRVSRLRTDPVCIRCGLGKTDAYDWMAIVLGDVGRTPIPLPRRAEDGFAIPAGRTRRRELLPPFRTPPACKFPARRLPA